MEGALRGQLPKWNRCTVHSTHMASSATPAPLPPPPSSQVIFSQSLGVISQVEALLDSVGGHSSHFIITGKVREGARGGPGKGKAAAATAATATATAF